MKLLFKSEFEVTGKCLPDECIKRLTRFDGERIDFFPMTMGISTSRGNPEPNFQIQTHGRFIKGWLYGMVVSETNYSKVKGFVGIDSSILVLIILTAICVPIPVYAITVSNYRAAIFVIALLLFFWTISYYAIRRTKRLLVEHLVGILNY
jgi:hypothetical protein